MKEIEEDTNKWKHVHGMEELTSLKCPYYPNQSIHSTKSHQDTGGMFHRTRVNIPKIYLEPQ